MMPRQSAGPKSAINDAPSRVSALRSLSCTLQEKLNQTTHCLMYNQGFNKIFFIGLSQAKKSDLWDLVGHQQPPPQPKVLIEIISL